MNPVEAFEQEVSSFLDIPHVVAVNSGTAALHVGLLASGLKPGMKVITTPFTFVATSNVIIHCGAKPIFVDIDPQTYCIDPGSVAKALEKEGEGGPVWGILCVHLFGNMCNMIKLLEIATGSYVELFEDASQAFGARYGNKYAGTIGHGGTFSCYYSKNIWTFEGGLYVTRYREDYEKARALRNHGFIGEEMVMMGYNYKMPWINAFLGAQLLHGHKPAILAELGRYGLKDGYYPLLVYEHPWYQANKHLWKAYECPNALEVAHRVKDSLEKKK